MSSAKMSHTSVPLLLWCLLLSEQINDVCCSRVSVAITNVGGGGGGGEFEGTKQDVDYYKGGVERSGKVDMFLGIPYAKPPVGQLRFAKPELIESYETTIDASKFGYMCTQERLHLLPKKFPISENCLFLNIYRPSNAQNLAVIVFLHGGFGEGRYANGGSNYISGDVLAVYADVIVVTLNYRLGLFGFYATDDVEDVSRGNFGLWDQHTALKWVHQNIASFGGDPNKVTLAGQQTGAICALYQAMYPGNKGLFQQVIAQSGSPTELAAHYAGAFTNKPGSYGVSHSLACIITELDDTLTCLRNYSYDDLALLTKTLQWPVSPVYDGDFIKADPMEMLDTSNTKYNDVKEIFNSMKLILGFNNMDGLAFLTNSWVPKFMWELLGKDDYKIMNVNKDVFQQIVNESINDHMYGVPYRNEPEPLNTVLSRYYNILQPDDYRQTIVHYSTDYYYLTPALLLANLRRQVLDSSMTSQRKPRKTKAYETYLYKFSVETDFNFRYKEAPSWAKGANNGDELPFLFGFSRRMLDALNVSKSYEPSKAHMRVAEQVMTKWGEFVIRGTVASNDKNGNGIGLERWPSCFENDEHSETSDISNLKYWDISTSTSINESASGIKSDFAGVMGRFWISMKHFVTEEKNEVVPVQQQKGDWFGLDMFTSETIIVVLVIVVFVLILLLVIFICCICLRKGNANYGNVYELT